MKNSWKLIGFFICIWSCSKPLPIDGVWKVNNPVYKAVYEIKDINEKKKAHVVSYNDGTSRFDSIEKTVYFFNDLRPKDLFYVDAISGATKTKQKQNRIEPIHKDTLKVTTYIHNKPIVEYWIKQPNQ